MNSDCINHNNYFLSNQTIEFIDQKMTALNEKMQLKLKNEAVKIEENQQFNTYLSRRHKSENSSLTKVNDIFKKIKENSINKNQFDQLDVFKLVKNFLKLQNALEKNFHIDCLPVIRKIFEDNVNQKIELSSKISNFLIRSFLDFEFLMDYEKELNDFHPECYEIHVELEKEWEQSQVTHALPNN
ncbi:MAG: hypothetical protein Q8K60_06565 [Parachlamydiaceae bacterium]|nr:hypothetical protein [Parachlamydiaceae bacterium]